jgi:hypothetical protein
MASNTQLSHASAWVLMMRPCGAKGQPPLCQGSTSDRFSCPSSPPSGLFLRRFCPGLFAAAYAGGAAVPRHVAPRRAGGGKDDEHGSNPPVLTAEKKKKKEKKKGVKGERWRNRENPTLTRQCEMALKARTYLDRRSPAVHPEVRFTAPCSLGSCHVGNEKSPRNETAP